MARHIKWILLLAVTAVGIVWLVEGRARAADEQAGAEDDRVAELSARIDSLEQEVTALKQQLQALQPGQAQVLSYEQLTPAVPALQNRPLHRVPSGEINGVPYYVIPLNADRQP